MQICHAREQYVRWLRATRDLSPHTIRAYDGDVAAFERHVGRGTSVDHIDRDRLVAFVEAQHAAGLCATSVKRRAAGVRGFCRWLVARRLIDADPWRGVTVRGGRTRALPRLLPAHELDRLLGSLRHKAGVCETGEAPGLLDQPHEATTLLAVALMLGTGARVNEVVSLRPSDVDLAGRSVRIVGKGRRERLVFLTNDWIKSLVEAYLSTRSAVGVEHGHLLFNGRFEPLTAAAMRTRLAVAAREAGLRARVTPHMLRHTAATQLIEAGVDIRYIQRLLGHASLRTTEIYTHVSDRALRRAVSNADVLGRLLRA